MSDLKYFIASAGVLGVRANTPSLKWSFGTIMPEATEAEYSACALRLRVNVTDEESDFTPCESDNGARGKYHYFSGVPEADVVSYQRAFLFGSKLKLEARGLLSEEPRLIVNSNYYRFVTHRFMNLHSAGYILTDLAALLLLRRGYAPLHCSAFRLGDATVVVLAPPNTGKTLSTMMACIEHGAEFIAEDLAITDGSVIYSVPWTSTFRYYSNVDERWTSRLLNRMTALFPPLELFTVTRPRPIGDYIEQRRLVDRASITHVVVLERGPEAITADEREDVWRRAVNLNRYEFNYHKAPVAVAYEYFNPTLDLDGACAKERAILRTMIQNAPHCWTVRSTDATRYAPMLVEKLQNG